MKEIITQSVLSLGTGMLAGFLFAIFKLPIPAPPVFSGIMGIAGITLSYMLVTKFL